MKCLKLCNSLPHFVLGIVFLLSGFAKAVNPYGFSVKVGEYVTAFNLDFFTPIVPFSSVFLIAVELSLGSFLLLRLFSKMTSVIVLIISLFFTFLTLWNLLFDSVGDCGCFGDVIKLSPLSSFIKNVVILLFAILNFRDFSIVSSNSNSAIVKTVVILVLSFALPIYVYNHLPLYDTSGYSNGTVLAYNDNSSVYLLYRNKSSNEIEKFLIEDSRWQDSLTWEFVGTEEVKKDGVSLPMLRDDFFDVSSDVLSSSDSLLVIVVQDPNIIPDLSDVHIRTILLSAYDLNVEDVEHYSSDYSLLKQVLPNSKGGALLIYHGQILDKWAMLDCPFLSSPPKKL